MIRLSLMQAKRLASTPVCLSAAFTSIYRPKSFVHRSSFQGQNSGYVARRVPTKSPSLLLSINFSFNCDYATDATIGPFLSGKSLVKSELSEVIDELKKKCVENGQRLSQYELKTVYNRIKTQKPTAAQVLQILELCSHGRADQSVEEVVKYIWCELHDAHEFHTAHYNYVLKFASDRQNVNFVQAIFDEMIADGTQPNAMSFEYLLAVYCKTGNKEKTNGILKMMDEYQVPLSERTYNYMLQCFITSGSVDDANTMIKNANNKKPSQQFKINRDTLTTALNHYSKSSDMENCQKTLKLSGLLNVELLNHDNFNLLNQLCIHGKSVDQCHSLFKYFTSNSELHTALHDAITLFVETDQSVEFMRIAEKLINDGNITDDIKPSVYKHLIGEMCRHNTPEHELETALKLIVSCGFTIEKQFDCFKSALKCTSPKWIRKVLAHMKANGMPVNEMSFERLFELAAMDSSSVLTEDDVLNVIDLMCVDFKIQPDFVYIRDVILPAILKTSTYADSMSIMEAAKKLRKTAILHRRTVTALINITLSRCDFETAIHLLNSKRYFYAIKFITAPLLDAYARTGDVRNFINILKIICQNFDKIKNYHPSKLSDAEIKQQKTAFIDEMQTAAVAHSLAYEQRLLELLEAFAENGFILSSNQIERIEQQISESKEHSSSLESVSTERDRIGVHLNADEIKQTLIEQRPMGYDVREIEKSLFYAYLREENLPEVEAMLAGTTFFSGELNLTPANYAMVIRLHIRHGNLEQALNHLRQATKTYATFKLHPVLLAQLITLMNERGGNQFNMDEIYGLLHAHRPNKKLTTETVSFHQLLQRLAANGHATYIQQIFDALLEFYYIQPTPQTAGPLITVHLNIGAYDLAVQKYQYIAKTFKFLAMSGILFKTLIQNEQTDLLQRAIAIHEGVYGKSATMSRLAFAYSGCGQIQKANEIFRSNQINQIEDLVKDIGKSCKRYIERNDLKSAELLLKSTAGMSPIWTRGRRTIYETILELYHKYGMAHAALELWTNMSNEGVLPKPTFLDKLAKLLQTNHIELPSDLKSKIERKIV